MNIPARIKDLAAKLLVLLVSLLIFFVSGELLLRAYFEVRIVYDVEMAQYANRLKIESDNPKIGHVHRPGKRLELMGVVIETNSDGLRDREYPLRKGEKRRIIFLGDSLTLGWGVRREATFEYLLESKLDSIRATEILNFGAGNYNTEQEVNLFLDKGLKYDPDHVVLFYFINDAEPTPAKSRWAFLGYSRMFTFLWSRTKAVIAKRRASMSYNAYYRSLYSDGQPGWTATRQALSELAEVCRERSIKLQVILLPELHNLLDYPFADEHAKVTTFLAGIGVPQLDIRHLFPAESDPRRLWVAIDDAHPNEIAHQMIADHSLEFLLDVSEQ